MSYFIHLHTCTCSCTPVFASTCKLLYCLLSLYWCGSCRFDDVRCASPLPVPRPTFLPHPTPRTWQDKGSDASVLLYPTPSNHILPRPTLDSPAILPCPTLSYYSTPFYPIQVDTPLPHIQPCPTLSFPS